ncbi:MAG: hypothetical protein AAGD25_24445 [Cyanobacteria bacterium P01_F01_bin.150]
MNNRIAIAKNSTMLKEARSLLPIKVIWEKRSPTLLSTPQLLSGTCVKIAYRLRRMGKTNGGQSGIGFGWPLLTSFVHPTLVL